MHISRVFSAFWIFGLVNNLLYVVILSAAIDLVGPTAPKAIVLMADVLPSFIFKLSAPFYIQRIKYTMRIWLLLFFNSTGMLIVALGSGIFAKILGIILASFASGLGEITFLQMTHFYEELSLHAWSSGTGGAGLVGAFTFMLMTTMLGVSAKITLLILAIVPVNLVLTYYYILPDYSRLERPKGESEEAEGMNSNSSPDNSIYGNTDIAGISNMGKLSHSIKIYIEETIHRIFPYVIPYMGPLYTVYLTEYMINQGVSPTLLFPLNEMPFSHYRDAYVIYSTMYQLGVFISRSSGTVIKIDRLYLPSMLQALNFLLCVWQSISPWLPNIYAVLCLIFYEGLLGGTSYVNTYRSLTENIGPTEREFAIGCVGMSDSAGILTAALISMFLEPSLCHYQTKDGRPWCQMN